MSRYSYAGDFVNPTDNFISVENPDGDGFILAVKVSTDEILSGVLNGSIGREEAELLQERGWRPHTNTTVFEEQEAADDWIEDKKEFFERDYDEYLEENRHSIVQMERYEMWRNEY